MIRMLTGPSVCAFTLDPRANSSEQTPLLSAAVATGGGRFGEPGFRVTMEPVRCFHEALREENEGEGDEAEDDSDVDSICSQLPATASTPVLTAASEAAVATAKATGLQHPKVQLHPLQASEQEHLARLEAAWHKQLHRQSYSSFLEWWRSARSAEGGFCEAMWRHKLLIGLVASIFIVGQLKAAAGRVRAGWRRSRLEQRAELEASCLPRSCRCYCELSPTVSPLRQLRSSSTSLILTRRMPRCGGVVATITARWRSS